MQRKDSDDKPADRDDKPSDFLVGKKDDLTRVKPKDQGFVEADDQKEDREIYDGSLELKIDEATEEHNGGVVEEIDHDPWGKEPGYGYQYDKEIVDKEIAAGEGVSRLRVEKSLSKMTR